MATSNGSITAELSEARSTLQATFASGKTRSYKWRISQVKAILSGIENDNQGLADALAADHNRSSLEASVEFGSLVVELKHTWSHLKKWMAPERVWTPPLLQPGSSQIEKTPKGVVLVIAPWNFPIALSLIPVMHALSAGNCVLLKPSEVSEKCAVALKQFCEKHLDQSAVRVILGGATETTELLAQQWDHIFYTGNGTIGKIIMEAAAKHLTPVTLELGGKSPVYIDAGLSDSLLRNAAERVIWTSFFLNAGQICVAPDWCLVPESEEKRVVEALKAAMQKMFPEGSKPSDTARVINSRHFERVKRLAETSGGEKFTLGVPEDPEKGFFPQTLIIRPDMSAPIATEEIFGPLMSVVPIKDLDEAIAFVNARQKPLALYIFSDSQKNINKFIAETNSGGVCVNDTLMHLGNPDLPFGGVGPSGYGAYHGKAGFDEFSHRRSVLQKTLRIQLPFIYPPYNSFKVDVIQRLQVGPVLKPRERRVATAVAVVLVGVVGMLVKKCLLHM